MELATPQGIPISIDCLAQDISDFSALAEIRAQEQWIMRLPCEQRQPAWSGLSPVLADFCCNQGTFKAIEQLYTRDGVRFHGLERVDDGGMARKWFECFNNARAIRERKTATTRLLVNSIRVRFSRDPELPIELASIASGSARCIIEALEQKPRDARVNAQMLDWDPEARRYSKALAEKAGVGKFVQTIAGNVLKLNSFTFPQPIAIAEAVGIMDYFHDRRAICFLRQVYQRLGSGGTLIASNIMPNCESEFVHTVTGWRAVYYRSAAEFAELFIRAGFNPKKCKLILTPLGIYSIMEAAKE